MKKVLFALLLNMVIVGSAFAHTATLSYTASPDTGVTYNIYRITGTCPATPVGFTKINTAPVSALIFVDTLSAGSYCYYVTAALNGAESVPSNLAPAVILPGAPTAVTITSTN